MPNRHRIAWLVAGAYCLIALLYPVCVAHRLSSDSVATARLQAGGARIEEEPAKRWIQNDPSFNFFSPFVFPVAVWVFFTRADLAPFRKLTSRQSWISVFAFVVLLTIMFLGVHETLRREPLEPFLFRDTVAAVASEEAHRAGVRELHRRDGLTDPEKEQLKALQKSALEEYKTDFPAFGSLSALRERGSPCAWAALGVNAASAAFVLVFFWFLWNAVLFHRIFALRRAEWIVLVAGLLVVWLPLRFYTEWYLGFYSLGTLEDFRLIKFIFVVAIAGYGLCAFTLAKRVTVKAFSFVGVGLLTLGGVIGRLQPQLLEWLAREIEALPFRFFVCSLVILAITLSAMVYASLDPLPAAGPAPRRRMRRRTTTR